MQTRSIWFSCFFVFPANPSTTPVYRPREKSRPRLHRRVAPLLPLYLTSRCFGFLEVEDLYTYHAFGPWKCKFRDSRLGLSLAAYNKVRVLDFCAPFRRAASKIETFPTFKFRGGVECSAPGQPIASKPLGRELFCLGGLSALFVLRDS